MKLPPLELRGQWVTAQAGQTADAIARQAGVPVEDVLELNDLADANAPLPAGTRLFVPEVAARAPAAPPDGQRFAWPLDAGTGTVSSGFGVREGHPHEGIDIAAPVGAPIRAVDDGEVAYAGNGLRGYGNVVLVRHGEGFLTVYAHNAQNLVQTGQRVARGQIIGRVGQSGHASGPHLHFEVRYGDAPRNPLRYLSEESQIDAERSESR